MNSWQDLLEYQAAEWDAERALVLQKFRNEWFRGGVPAIERFIDDVPRESRGVTLAALVSCDLHCRLARGGWKRTTDYLRAFPELASRPDLTREIYIAELFWRGVYSNPPAADEPQPEVAPSVSREEWLKTAALAEQYRRESSVAGGGRFFILRTIGRGGMGMVFEALDREHHRIVALKKLPFVSPRDIFYFKKEFRTLAETSHPRLVRLFELFTEGGEWYFTMERIEGIDFLTHVTMNAHADSLIVGDASAPNGDQQTSSHEICEPKEVSNATSVSSPCRDFGRLRTALVQVVEGVMALHDAGILHRDLKPSNVMVRTNGEVVILDFGLVTRIMTGGEIDDNDDSSNGSGSSATSELTLRPGAGTAAYMSPEQAGGEILTTATDYYALGVMLFRALTGVAPFLGSVDEIRHQKKTTDAPAPNSLNPHVPEDLNRLCVDLLQRDPTRRPGGAEVLRRLAPPASAEASFSGKTVLPAGPYVGRQPLLQSLRRAFERTTTLGPATVVHVHGPSGVGKTRLVQQFLHELRVRNDAEVLEGRCYESESVPFKAIDSLIDALTTRMRTIPDFELDAILPADITALATIFPVLEWAASSGSRDDTHVALVDPREFRRRAFAALRELLINLSRWRPLVLVIDDLQWGDADSAAALAEVLRCPSPPRLILIVSYRDGDTNDNACIRSLRYATHATNNEIATQEISLSPLAPDETRLLAERLLAANPNAKEQVSFVVEQSRGMPFLIQEIAAELLSGDKGIRWFSDAPADEVLWQRVQSLPDEARRLLEVLVVFGEPLPAGMLLAAAELPPRDHHWLTDLRARRLVQTSGTGAEALVSLYHDRVRETIAARISAPARATYHRRLAMTWERSGSYDAEAVASHFFSGGDAPRANRYFLLAAKAAAKSLAFDRAARLFQRTLEFSDLDENERWRLTAELGDALANAGRGAEAAVAYEAAAERRDGATSLELRSRAAYQYCISGHIDQGRIALRRVLEQVDLRLPETPSAALLSFLSQRAWLWLRGLRFRLRDSDQVPAEDLRRIDIAWAATAGVSMFDVLSGAALQTKHCLLALRAGEPFRLVRALAWEAAHNSNLGGSAWRRTNRLLTLAKQASTNVSHPYAQGILELSMGVAEFTSGRWGSARTHLEAAEVCLRERCTGVAWELGTARAFTLWLLPYLGELRELDVRSQQYSDEAGQRGDLYAATTHAAFAVPVSQLVRGDLDAARETVRGALARWNVAGFHVQHIVALMAQTYLDLYQGDGEAAWGRMVEQWPFAERSNMLRVQVLRSITTQLRARSALAASWTSSDGEELLRQAERDARQLHRERMPYCEAHALHIDAGVAARRGNLDAATALWRKTIAAYEACQMRLYAAAGRWRLGELVQGDEGAALLTQARDWFQSAGVAQPTLLCDAFAASVRAMK